MTRSDMPASPEQRNLTVGLLAVAEPSAAVVYGLR